MTLDLEAVLAFASNGCFSGVFAMSFVDTAHSLMELLVCVIFVFVTAAVLVSLGAPRLDGTTA
jgi:hypothetical protein